MFIYLDNAATTRVSDTALSAMLPYFQGQYGNPSSLYAFGQEGEGGAGAGQGNGGRAAQL